jgi:tetratricopeptide (TPR) repeat protein
LVVVTLPASVALSSTSKIVIDTAAAQVSSWNRQTYQRLKLSLTLGLRRQIFVAVCDDLSLRNRLAGKLHAELGALAAKTPAETNSYPRLVSLNLNLRNPNPLAQITQWLAQQGKGKADPLTFSFQIVGVERLTRQPPVVQREFLRHLQAIEANLPRLESTLLLWLPRPWFNTIQQSVPEFWRWHTGVFEFEGEPTPVPPARMQSPEASHAPVKVAAPAKESLQVVQKPVSPKTTAANQEKPLQQDSPPSVVPNGKSASPTNGSSSTLLPAETPTAADSQLDESSQDVETTEPISPQSQADVYLQLGNHYRYIIEQGDVSAENLMLAIQAYEQALQWLDADLAVVSDILNDLGNLYWMISRLPSSGEQALPYLEQGIQAYQIALSRLTAENAPQTFAMIQNNLGAAYGDLARYKDPVESLQLSIRAYTEALRYRSAETEPLKYASTQNNLGTAHWHLAQQHAPVQNLRAAIASYTEALAQYDCTKEPLNWAMIQNNIGTAYWNLAQYEQPEKWLQLAIATYTDALKYRTPEATPAACAATQNNLGTAYWHLADRFPDEPQPRAEYLQLSIGIYEKALAIAHQLRSQTPPVAVNFDVFATHNNLGLAYYQLATEPRFSLPQGTKSAHLEAALHQHLQALQGSVGKTDSYQSALSYIVKTIRAFYHECGMPGQNLALSKIPGQLLPEILPRL